ncbi:MAG: mannose-1-phosphate guanylyltransferase/mannose-6-phosphate isomerase, partial [Nitrospinaceae bacterium]|nr:mannose-1-phosphate guanylyltransferase/mannose-6-phosphate isomerase [Nitrospinaceae bacterium]NIR57836.1 mannose-1-phosphate guanylyltransferase/mannose-6-phosphate isomerase [Nitrospinaceae bacterium]NIS88299.1 mannose-1-phosphate guanylyltransferase/mannose-6-phosphate isomerase [Nitrospinaceae bacterium]NIT85177.1 mannose-1-phosphate guanylyltransferase/mannose-6-phosphate isomerase [Nitrospinaceae bacterium]NIU47330.1 mannose-1-phosphate guanylyltransferase/mannose-6-phosphate isomeras
GGIPIDRLHLVTHERHAFESCRLLAALGFPASHLWAEPVGRNTAPAIALAARVLQDKNPDEVMAVFPADHVIPDEDRFLRILRRAEQAAAAGFLVTLGIRPTRPETGYGYIRKGVPIDGLEETFRVRQFVEKPDASTARTYLEEGDYFWNGGMFLGKVSTFLEELKRHLPEVFQVLDDLVTHTQENKGKYPYRTLDSEGRKIYESLPDISVDYAVLEKTENLALVPAELRWSDVGSWRALGDIQKVDREGNLCTPNVVVLDCSDSILQGEERLIAGVGLRNLIVVDTPDALLVCDKDRAQDVKKLVQQLERENRPEIELGSTVRKPWGSYTVLEKRSHYLVKRIEVL